MFDTTSVGSETGSICAARLYSVVLTLVRFRYPKNYAGWLSSSQRCSRAWKANGWRPDKVPTWSSRITVDMSGQLSR